MEYSGIFRNTPGFYRMFQIIVIPLYFGVFQNVTNQLVFQIIQKIQNNLQICCIILEYSGIFWNNLKVVLEQYCMEQIIKGAIKLMIVDFWFLC